MDEISKTPQAKKKKRRAGNKKKKYYTQNRLNEEFGFSPAFIESHFPEPVLRPNRHRRSSPVKTWSSDTVHKTLQRKSVKAELERIRKRKEQKLQKENELRELLEQYTPDLLIARGRELRRSFLVHVGPTNSGKTHDALEELKASRSGMYLGPLRLLALEMFDRLNGDGIPCSLLTGEEQQLTENAAITASTIELCDFYAEYETVVIDEAQMISDPDRGSHWLKAICLVKAKTVHICCAPEAEHLICGLLTDLSSPYEVIRHERLVPLLFSGPCRSLKEIRPGDAIITFSRKNVLNIAGLLEQQHVKASVIYGALPPEARRREVYRYTSGETSVVVATDAIGMGISLPIKRIIFSEISKFDGTSHRPLTPVEIRQIAGRAGRFGMFDHGEVLSMVNARHIRNGLETNVTDLSHLRLPFPKEVLESDFQLRQLLETWRDLPPVLSFDREDVHDALFLLRVLGNAAAGHDKSLIFDLVTCPVNIKSDQLVHYWLSCAKAILSNKNLPYPSFGSSTLESCELQYNAFDIHHQLLRRIGIEEDCEKEKSILCAKINEFLKKNKSAFIRRCRLCGKILPVSSQYSVCDACYQMDYSMKFPGIR